MYSETVTLLFNGLLETIIMSFGSLILGFFIGLPLGFSLFLTKKGNLLAIPKLNFFLSIMVDFGRAIPFIILLVWLIPITRTLVGTSIGMKAAIIPLTITSIPFIARMTENALLEVSQGLTETGKSLGASNWQIITKILLPETIPSFINTATITLITLISYSAMAGAIGSGGLGQIGYKFGYVSYRTDIMNYVIILLVLLVLLVQLTGDYLVRKFNHK